MTDLREKVVLDALIDKVSTMFPLSNALTDMGEALRKGDTAEIVTRSSITIQQASTGTGAATMTVQTNTGTPNLLTVDQHYGAIVQIGKMNAQFDMNGSWKDQLASQVLIELDDYIDIDVYKRALLFGGAWTTGTANTYWTNVAGATVTADHVETTMAKMLDQKGVRKQFCIWAFRPFGMSAVRRLAAFTPISIDRQADGVLGVKTVGMLHGIPVIESQSVPDQLTVATTAAVTTGTGTVHTYTVAAGHPLVAGMLATVAGHDADENIATPTAITSTTTVSVVITTSATNDGTSTDTSGLITVNLTCNGLIYQPWSFIKKSRLPSIEIVPTSGGLISDELQATAIWGAKGLTGCFMGLGSPRQSVS